MKEVEQYFNSIKQLIRCEQYERKDFNVKKVKIAVMSLPIPERISTRPAFCSSLLELVKTGAAEGADLVLLPQYAVPLEKAHELIPELSGIAAEYSCYIVYNTETQENGNRYNDTVILDRLGKEVGCYRKTHVIEGLDVGIDVGSDMPVFELDFGKAAILSGTDIFIPELTEIYAVKGAQLFLVCGGTEPLNDDTQVQRLLGTRAIQCYNYLAYSSYASEKKMFFNSNIECMNDGNMEYDSPSHGGTSIDGLANVLNANGMGLHQGRACVLDYRGETLGSTGREAGVTVAAIDMDRKERIKEYVFGWADIIKCQKPRGVFDALTDIQYTPAMQKRKTVRVAALHLPYKRTINETMRVKDGEQVPTDYEYVFALCHRAGARGVDVICTSEYAVHWDNPSKETLDQFGYIAAEHGCYIIVNFARDKEYNITQIWDRRGKMCFEYEKVNNLCFVYDGKMPAGDKLPVFEADFGTIGIMVCADVYSQEIPRIYALQGADIIFQQSQSWGYDTTAIGDKVISGYCIENSMYVVHVNFPSSQVCQRSAVFDPTGHMIAASNYNLEGILYADLDMDAVYKKPSLAYTKDGVGYCNNFRERMIKARRPALYTPLTSYDK